MIEPLDTAVLRALGDAATPPPWQPHMLNHDVDYPYVKSPTHGMIADPVESSSADAEFIAAARNALPGLLDRLDTLEAENQRLREQGAEAVRQIESAVRQLSPWVTEYVGGGSGLAHLRVAVAALRPVVAPACDGEHR